MTAIPAYKNDSAAPSTGDKRSDEAPENRVARFRPGELRRIFRLQHGRQLPDDDVGRSRAGVMLDTLAWSGEEGRQLALNFLEVWCPWMLPEERDEAIERAFAARRFWSAKALGDELGLTVEVRKAARARTIRAAGMTDADMAMAKKAQDAERKREERLQRRLHPEPKRAKPAVRAAAVAELLHPGDLVEVTSICAELKRRRSIPFAGLAGNALRTAVHRAIEYGISEGFLESQKVRGPNGLEAMQVRRCR